MSSGTWVLFIKQTRCMFISPNHFPSRSIIFTSSTYDQVLPISSHLTLEKLLYFSYPISLVCKMKSLNIWHFRTLIFGLFSDSSLKPMKIEILILNIYNNSISITVELCKSILVFSPVLQFTK